MSIKFRPNLYPTFFRPKVKYILDLWKEEHGNRRNLEKNRQKLWAHGKLEWNRGISTLHFQMKDSNYLQLMELLILIIAWQLYNGWLNTILIKNKNIYLVYGLYLEKSKQETRSWTWSRWNKNSRKWLYPIVHKQHKAKKLWTMF